MAWRLAALILLMAALIVILARPARITHDVAMYLYMGDRLLEGAVPYVDIIDLNPPLIIYLSAIPAGISRALGTYPPVTLLIAVWLLTVCSAASAWRILRAPAAEPHSSAPSSRADVVAAAVAALSLWQLSADGFGQREHLFAIAFVPYLLLRQRRQSGGAISPLFAAAVGTAAGVAACLKPHFVILALAPEVYWRLRRTRTRAGVPVELIALVVAGVLYALHFLLVPGPMREAWSGRWLPLIAAGYRAYDQPLRVIVADWPLWMPPLAGVAFIAGAARRRDWWRERGPAILIVTVVATLNVFVQKKGWAYHAIPAQAMLFLASGLAAAALTDYWDARSAPWLARIRVLAVRIAVILLIVQGVVAAALMMPPRKSQAVASLIVRNPLARAIAERTSPGDAVWIFSTSVNPAFPLMVQLERRHASRFMFAFALPLLYRDAGGTAEGPFSYRLQDPQRAAAEARFRADMETDVHAMRPEMILVPPGCQACPEGFTLHEYLRASGFLQTAMADYREVPPVGDVRVYVRREDP